MSGDSSDEMSGKCQEGKSGSPCKIVSQYVQRLGLRFVPARTDAF